MRPQLRLVPQPRGAQGAALKRKLTSAAAEAARAAAAEACVDAGRALLERLLTKACNAHGRAPYFRRLGSLRRSARLCACVASGASLEAFCGAALAAGESYRAPAKGEADVARRKALAAAAFASEGVHAALSAAPPLSALLARGHFAPLAAALLAATARLRTALAAFATALARAYTELSDAALALPGDAVSERGATEELPATLTATWEGDALQVRAVGLLDVTGGASGASGGDGFKLERVHGLGLGLEDELGAAVTREPAEGDRAAEEAEAEADEARREAVAAGGTAGFDSDESDLEESRGVAAMAPLPRLPVEKAKTVAHAASDIDDIFGSFGVSAAKAKAKKKRSKKDGAVDMLVAAAVGEGGGGDAGVAQAKKMRKKKRPAAAAGEGKAKRKKQRSRDAIDDIFGAF